MPRAPRILGFSGSARKDSLNRKYLAGAAAAVREAGAEVNLISLADFSLPLYNGDLEDADGLPENAARLIALVTQHDGLLVASPEYNSMVTPLLKNTVDWCSRSDENPFTGRTACVISASPGILGGVRSLQLAQLLLLKLGCEVVPGQFILPHADRAFDAQGGFVEERVRASMREMAVRFVRMAGRLAS